MKKLLPIFILLLSSTSFAATNPSIEINTSLGQITLELYPEQAPTTVANFIAYVKKDGFKQSIFHRIINNFMIQGGGENTSGKQLSNLPAIPNESKNGISNQRGTIAMARTGNPHSATRQFFINQKDNTFLDAKSNKWGYTVFGKVTAGMQVVDKIAAVKTNYPDRPIQQVIINNISLKTEPKKQ